MKTKSKQNKQKQKNLKQMQEGKAIESESQWGQRGRGGGGHGGVDTRTDVAQVWLQSRLRCYASKLSRSKLIRRSHVKCIKHTFSRYG